MPHPSFLRCWTSRKSSASQGNLRAVCDTDADINDDELQRQMQREHAAGVLLQSEVLLMTDFAPVTYLYERCCG